MNRQRTRNAMIVPILFVLFTLLFPHFSSAMTLNNPASITQNSMDLSWSRSTSLAFSRYEVYQSLGPINDNAATLAVPTPSERALWTFVFLLFATGLLFLKRQRRVGGMALILISLLSIAYGLNAQVTIYVSRDGFCGGHTPCYSTIQDGIDSVSVPSIIEISQETYPEDVVLDINQMMALEGGWDESFASCSSYTIIGGSLAIAEGTMIIGGTGRIILSTPPPTINSFSANPGTVNSGQSSTLSWTITNATSASIDHGGGSVNPASGSISVNPATTTIYTLTATNDAGSVTAQATVTVIVPPTINVFSVDPATIDFGGGSTLSWMITNGTSASIDNGVGSVNPASGSIDVSPVTTTTYTLTATNVASSVTAHVTVTVTLPPDPITVAPPLDGTVSTDMKTATSFLYEGDSPIQTGVAPGAIEPKRTAVLRGKVLDKNRSPLPGVTITILNHPEYGQTLSRLDGMFDMAVNGGGHLTVNYQKGGYLPAQRRVNVSWQDYAWLPDVVLITLDSQVTTIDLTASIPIQVGRGSVVTDSDGTRQATLLFPQGIQAQMVMPDGSLQPITTLSFRATEFTVGPNGQNAMPAELPPASFYTYCVELSADEALVAGAKGVQFSQAVTAYVENFLNFPVGIGVPVGFYDKAKGAWIPSADGRVIKIISISAGLADLDTDGDGSVDNGVALGITNAERQQLGGLYSPGQTLWRISVTHFTSYDCNYGIVPPLGATIGPLAGVVPGNAQNLDKPCSNQNWGCVEFQNQIFGEAINIIGTPYRLHYSSNRVPGYIAPNTLKIPLSSDIIPPLLKRIQLEVLVAGRRFIQSFPAAANQEHTFFWDGQDAYGRRLQGQRLVTVRIGYVYNMYYALPPDMAASFGFPSGVKVPGDIPAREEVTLWQEEHGLINIWDINGLGLGGWSLSPHHVYDPQGKVLYYGDGKRRSIESMNSIITSVAGTGTCGHSGDGGPATQAKLYSGGIAVGPDGSLYIGGMQWIRRVTPDGVITTYAGTGAICGNPMGPCGDGGPATHADVFPFFMKFGPDGALYFSDKVTHRIRKVDQSGIISSVAGSGDRNYSGDDGPALNAGLDPGGLTIGADGALYIADASLVGGSLRPSVRRVSPDGIINTFAGNGTQDYSGDGGPATQAGLGYVPTGLDMGPDGSLYTATDTYNGVRRVTPDGIINRVAGRDDFSRVYSGDGGPATLAGVMPSDVAINRDGSFYIADWGNNSVRRVGPDGIITTIAGGDNLYHAYLDGEPATQVYLSMPYSIATAPDGSLYISGLSNCRVLRVFSVFRGFDAADIAIASEDGSLLFQFDAIGRHLSTINTLTGATLFQFGYDVQNRLISITDGDGDVTTVERDAAGTPTGIVGPYGQCTTLTLNAGGYLASVTNPASETTQLGYGTEGLLTSVTGPKGVGFTYSMTYDGLGRLTLAQDPAGGSNTLSRTDVANGHQVGITTAMSRSSSYLTETLSTGIKHYRNTFEDGTVAESNTGTDEISTTTLPDGTVTTGTPGPDPRFGMQAPIGKGLTISTGGLTSITTSSRVATLTDPNNPLSLQTLTDTAIINGRTFTSTYDAASHTFTVVSPLGRQSTGTIDGLGRTVSSQIPGLNSTNAGYDGHGRLSTLTTGTGPEQRTTGFEYDSNGYLETITDSLGRVTRFSYDPAGRVTQQTLPDGRIISYNYDGQNNLTSITPPSRPAHAFNYTVVDLVSEYIPPDVGAGANHTLYSYNTDRQLTQVTRPDGGTINLSYNTGGKLSNLSFPGGSIGYAYDSLTGKLTDITTADGGTLSFGYSGSLPTTATWTGSVVGNLSRTYDNDFRITSRSVNGGNTVIFQSDNDSLLTGVGDLTLTRNAQNGLLIGTVLGNVTDSWNYNGFGEPLDYTAAYGGGNIYLAQYTYDKLGRITQKTETIGGTADTYDYAYDLAGRLIGVDKNDTTISTYSYDSDGNRLSYFDGISTVNGTYDNQDRLLTYGGATYQYTANGELQGKTIGAQTTTYQYDALGNLLGVTLPDATQIQYLVDGLNRRIGKKINGTLVKGFLYGGQLSPVAELDGSNNLVSYFVYGSRANVPDYMVRGGATYRILSDHLGSPRLIVNTATGAIAQRMDYDGFGRVINDTNPGFQPFGFGGGVYDSDTGLVRFGARDYDAETGRWTNRDPILFAGNSINLYTYVRNNPLNQTDRFGLGPNGLTEELPQEESQALEPSISQGLGHNNRERYSDLNPAEQDVYDMFWSPWNKSSSEYERLKNTMFHGDELATMSFYLSTLSSAKMCYRQREKLKIKPHEIELAHAAGRLR